MPGVFLWSYDHINDEWVKVPACVTTKRMTGTGKVVEGAHKLYWVLPNPSAVNCEAALTDNLTGDGDPVIDGFSSVRDSLPMNLIPPMQFTTGIYLKTLEAMTSITFGYV